MELGLFVLVHHIQGIRTVVEVLIPVNTNIIVSWDVLPIFFVFRGELRTLFGSKEQGSVHEFWHEGAANHQYDSGDKEAY